MIAVAAVAVLGMGIVASVGDRRAKVMLHDRKILLDAALNNMMQGVNMSRCAGAPRAVQRALSADVSAVARRREARMHDPRAGGQSCIKSGTFFAIDPEQYIAELSRRRCNTIARQSTKVLELEDGRVISVASQPMADGGWVVTHADITERHLASRELERTRNFLNTVIENVPVAILVKDARRSPLRADQPLLAKDYFGVSAAIASSARRRPRSSSQRQSADAIAQTRRPR